MALAAPSFPQMENGVITLQEINISGAVIVNIPFYSNPRAGDQITIIWNFSAVASMTLTTDFPLFPISILVPEIYIPSVGSYNVFYIISDSHGNTSTSYSITVQITAFLPPPPAGQLQMILTTNASNYDWPAINVFPVNRGVITGSPGTQVMVTVSDPGLIGDGVDRRDVLLTLGGNGQADFSLYSEEQGLLVVFAYAVANPLNSVTLPTTIGPFRLGNGRIKSVNYSTGAPANNRTYNSIYLKTEAETSRPGEPITFVRAIIVEGSARIAGYPGYYADIILNGDKSATINLANTVSERVVVELSLPEESGSVKTVETVFVPPSASAFSVFNHEQFIDYQYHTGKNL